MEPGKRTGLSLLTQEGCQGLRALDAASLAASRTALPELSACLYFLSVRSQSLVRLDSP